MGLPRNERSQSDAEPLVSATFSLVSRTMSAVVTMAGLGALQLYVESTRSAAAIVEKFPAGLDPGLQILEGAAMAGIGVLSYLWAIRNVRFERDLELASAILFLPLAGVITYAICMGVVGPAYHGIFGPEDAMNFFR